MKVMDDRRQNLSPLWSGRRPFRQKAPNPFCRCLHMGIFAALLCGLLSGCAAVSNPATNGIPVRRLSPDLLCESKEGLENIPLSRLRQPPPASYELARGD